MEKYSELIDKYVKEVLNILESTNNVDFLVKIAEDLIFDVRFKLLAEQIVGYALNQNKLVNSFFLLKSVSRNYEQRTCPEGLAYFDKDKIDLKNHEPLTGGLVLVKGTLLKMLDKMSLTESRREIVKRVIIEDEETDATSFFPKNEIKSFDNNDFEIILKKELEEKYSGKPIVIKLK